MIGVMPVHDWKRVKAGIFHDFHQKWNVTVCDALNDGLLPEDYYALVEQNATEEDDDGGGRRPNLDVLTLGRLGEDLDGPPVAPRDDFDLGNATALVDAPPRTRITIAGDAATYAERRKTVVVRHAVRDDRPVALLEIASPGNKDRPSSVAAFVGKCEAAFAAELHLVVIDVHPPRRHDPGRLPATVADAVGLAFDEGIEVAAASFEADFTPRAYADPFADGEDLPVLPLFYKSGWYVNLDLQATYDAAFARVPRRWRQVLERPAA